MNKQKIYRVDDVRDGIFQLRREGSQKGEWAGFRDLHEHYSIKEGSFTILFAAPAMGKSQFSIEVMMNMAEYKGWKWIVATPEMGSPKEVFAELCWAYLRKPFLEYDGDYATDEEAQKAIEFVQSHFIVVDAGADDMSIADFYTTIEDTILEDPMIKGVLIDPYTEFKSAVAKGVRDDIAVGQDLTLIRKMSNKYNIHTIVAVHTRHQQVVTRQSSSGRTISYLPEPTFNDIAGGTMWSRKVMAIIALWRCPLGLEDEHGNPYEPNQVKIRVLKAKPKSIGRSGDVYLFYDRMQNRYYHKEGTDRIYSYPDPNSFQQIEIPL